MLAISHLMFTNDTFLFCRANAYEVRALHSCLETYEKWLGLAISKDKSGVVFSKNTLPHIQAKVCSILGFKPFS